LREEKNDRQKTRSYDSRKKKRVPAGRGRRRGKRTTEVIRRKAPGVGKSIEIPVHHGKGKIFTTTEERILVEGESFRRGVLTKQEGAALSECKKGGGLIPEGNLKEGKRRPLDREKGKI